MLIETVTDPKGNEYEITATTLIYGPDSTCNLRQNSRVWYRLKNPAGAWLPSEWRSLHKTRQALKDGCADMITVPVGQETISDAASSRHVDE